MYWRAVGDVSEDEFMVVDREMLKEEAEVTPPLWFQTQILTPFAGARSTRREKGRQGNTTARFEKC